jgi:hypothetical protein
MLLFKRFYSPFPFDNPLQIMADGTEINSASVNAGGNGYSVNDIFIINGGNELAIGKVLAVGSGVVTSFSILFCGNNYAVVNGLTTNTISGAGSGLIVNINSLYTRNAIFSHSVLGNDSNPGTRTLPFQTLTKLTTRGELYRGAIGNFTENVNYGGGYYFFEGESSLNGILSCSSTSFFNYKAKQAIAGDWNYFSNCYFPIMSAGTTTNNTFISTFKGVTANVTFSTIASFYNYGLSAVGNNTFANSIFLSSVDLYRFYGQTSVYPIFRYSLFRKHILWQWNGVTITITYTDPANYMQDVWNSLFAYANAMSAGADKTYFLFILGSSLITCPIFYSDSITGQTNKVVDDNPLTGIPVFNKYTSDGNTILDYSLLLSSNNVALTMGDPALSYQYVGCYRANIGGQNTSNPMVYGDILNVNTDGSDDTVTVPNLLMIDNLGEFLMNQDSLQFWNRIRTNVLSYDRGKASYGTGSQLSSAMGSGYYFGKKRKYDTTHCVVESIEVLPYDNPTTPSTAPKFSMAFNGQTLVYYWTGGIKIGLPVLFNDLAGIGIAVDATFLSIYGTWAVSTSDLESYDLSQFTSLVGAKQYPLTYFAGELNAHYKS